MIYTPLLEEMELISWRKGLFTKCTDLLKSVSYKLRSNQEISGAFRVFIELWWFLGNVDMEINLNEGNVDQDVLQQSDLSVKF